jgi:hypothetical protein
MREYRHLISLLQFGDDKDKVSDAHIPAFPFESSVKGGRRARHTRTAVT